MLQIIWLSLFAVIVVLGILYSAFRRRKRDQERRKEKEWFDTACIAQTQHYRACANGENNVESRNRWLFILQIRVGNQKQPWTTIFEWFFDPGLLSQINHLEQIIVDKTGPREESDRLRHELRQKLLQTRAAYRYSARLPDSLAQPDQIIQ